MKAMVLAAGLGTRLRPLTDNRPKALVEVAGRSMLEITLSRLREFGIRDVIVNAHHFARLLTDYLHVNRGFAMNLEVSHEDVLLDTGGGLRKAAHFFSDSSEPFLLHNVDVLSNVDFGQMLQYHKEQNALATLAVHDRPSSRLLLFDQQLQLCGRRNMKMGTDEIARPSASLTPLAFSGIHVISPRIFEAMTETGAFSIIDSYLRLAGEGYKIAGFRADEYYWRDLGTEASLREAETDIDSGRVHVGTRR
jgi:NDP-sugar pyrophosphorylase family protein